MIQRRTLLACVAGAALLVACGGSDTVPFDSVVSFGDSLSDAGTYRVGDVATSGGGQFTINGPDGKVWTQYLSDSLNAPPQCAARTGLLPNNGVTGAPVTDVQACNNYAQGSSRVTFSGTGPNGVGLQAYGDINLGFMADSLLDQMNRHLAKIGGKFSGQPLVTVNGGANDLFVQLNAIASAADGGQAAAAAAQIAGWPADVIAIVSGGGTDATAAAAAAAVVAMSQAGAELAGYVKTLLVANGARNIVVRNLGDVNFTPYGLTLDASTQGLITAMTSAFNGELASGLAGTAGVLLYDDYANSKTIAADPTAAGFSDVTTPACAANAFSSVDETSLFCTTGTLIAGDTSHFYFADDAHPTPYAHMKTAQAVLDLLYSVNWQ